MLLFYAEGDYIHPLMKNYCNCLKKIGIKFDLEIDKEGTVHYPPS